MKPFVDANVLIKAFTNNNEKESCRKVLTKAFVTDTLCLLEAHHGITIIKNNQVYASNCIKALYKSSGTILQVDHNLLFESLKRVDRYPLTIFDLVHYVTALLHNCSVFISYDKDFNDLELRRIEP